MNPKHRPQSQPGPELPPRGETPAKEAPLTFATISSIVHRFIPLKIKLSRDPTFRSHQIAPDLQKTKRRKEASRTTVRRFPNQSDGYILRDFPVIMRTNTSILGPKSFGDA